jgi:hypothetical protein
MYIYDNLTPALRDILLNFTRGYALWVSFEVDACKVEGIREKWIETCGTNLPAWKRQDRKQKGLPNAWAAAAPVLGYPNRRQVILMASDEVSSFPESQLGREKWNSRPPEFSDFVMVREARERGDYAWTWRIQDRVLGLLEKHLVSLVKAGDRSAVAIETRQMAELYPMFGGVRRQLARMLKSSGKLWTATQPSPWPGLSADKLPMMVGFKGTRRPVEAQRGPAAV